jgi:hypothetical protein
MYMIQNASDSSSFWSNEYGWCSQISADKYGDINGLNLPLEGIWVSLWEINQIQFARLITELEQCGALKKEYLEQVAEATDLEFTEVCEIIDRAKEFVDNFNTTI